MKRFEKFLTDLPKPAVEVPAFRDQLRRELLSAAPTSPSRHWRFAAVGMTALASLLVVALGIFVARPEIPADLHAVLTGSGSDGRETLNETNINRLLGRVGLPLEADRAFVDSWAERQAGPVAIRSMNDERLVSVRQFELTNGKQMLVFTELSDEEDRPKVVRAGSTAQFF
jgi:hypothetical protein